MKIIKNYAQVLFAFLIILTLLVYFSIIAPLLPLGGDEAWSYLGFSQFGPLYVATHYELPNNHIFFNLIQSLYVHKWILWYFPLELRFFNSIVGAVLLTLSAYYLSALLKNKTSIVFGVFTILSLFFASPLITPYFFLARGYLLGVLLLLAGIYCLSTKKFVYATLFFTLCTWTVPTFIFAIPFQYLAALYMSEKKHRKQIFVSGLFIPIISFVLYLPVINQFIANTNVGWGYLTLQKFSLRTFNSLSNLSYIPGGLLLNTLFVLTYIYSFAVIYKIKNFPLIKKIAIFMFLSISGYLALVITMFVLDFNSTPFARNGMFIPLFSVLTILAASCIAQRNWERLFFKVILISNLVAGLFLFAKITSANINDLYPAFEAEQHYTSKALVSFLETGDKELLKNDTLDTIQIMYYAEIYGVDIEE